MVGTGGFDPHGSLTPDHDAAADLKMRQRDVKRIGHQFVAACTVCVLAIGLLYLLTLMV
jgi:hypothetical protein